MSEDNQLLFEIVSDFIMRFKKTGGHDLIRELLERCSRSTWRTQGGLISRNSIEDNLRV